jgi:hypothetical protein
MQCKSLADHQPMIFWRSRTLRVIDHNLET